MKHSINPEMNNPIRFEKNVGDAEGVREFYFDPYQGAQGTLYTYGDVSERGNFEDHGSITGATPINENTASAMFRHYWDVTLQERTQIRIDAGFDDEAILPEAPPEDIDQIEGNPSQNGFNADVHNAQEREKLANPTPDPTQTLEPPPVNNGIPMITISLGEYIQSRDIIRSQDIALKIISSLLATKLDPQAHEHLIIEQLLKEVETASENIYEENK